MGRLSRMVGPAAVAVTVAGTAVPAGQLDGYTIRRGRAKADEATTAATCTLNVYAAALPALPAVGDQVRVELGPDAQAWLGVAADDPAVPRFVGTVTEASIVPRRFTGANRDVVQIVAASALARIGRTFIGDAPWPSDLDGDRASRILAESLGQPEAGTSGYLTWSNPDLRVGSSVGDEFIYARPGSGDHPLDRPPAGDGAPQRLSDADAPVGSGATARTYFVGRTVPVTPGGTYRVSCNVEAQAVDSLAALNIVAGDLALAQLAGPVGPIGDGIGTNVTVAGQTALFTVPAGVTDLLIGVEQVDRVSSSALLPGWFWLFELTLAPYIVAGPFLESPGGTVQVLPRDVDRQNALTLLSELAADAAGVLVDRRDGDIRYADADDRRGSAVAITLDDSEAIVGTTWATGLDGLVNDVTYGYGETPAGGSGQASVQVVDQPSIDAYGPAAISRGTQLANRTDAERAAARLVGLAGRPAYRMPGLAVDLLATLTTAAQRLALLRCEQGALVAVTDFPASGPLTTGQLWLEGWTEALTAHGWRFDLAVSPYLAGGPGLAYLEVDPALTYAAVPADVTNLSAWGYDARPI